LIADDHEIVRQGIRSLFDLQTDWEICGEAVDGLDAIEKSKHLKPDVILLDWNMPKMDGYEFLRLLRKMPNGDVPRVVFCTTENDVAHIARALHAGADEYIMKPFDKDIIQAKFQEVGVM